VNRPLYASEGKTIETKYFKNPGYGWLCKRCNGEENAGLSRGRFFSEGDLEESDRSLTKQLAKWVDEERKVLKCPQCGQEERLGL
jgi:hypothetical protein